MTKITRRLMLGGFAATAGGLAAATIPATVAVAAPDLMLSETSENPALLHAYARLTATLAELKEAKSALEWLADEWRHLWPLAPEEILHGANADRHDWSTAERDIIGNYLMRDTSDLTTRLSRKRREQAPTTCFSILTPEDASDTIELWSRYTARGRTEKALESNRARRDRIIREYQHKLALAREYQAETTRLREAAGVAPAKQRRKDAYAALTAVCGEISTIPAFTHEGLRIKAEAIKASGIFDGALHANHVMGEMARFIESTIAVGGRGSGS